MLYVDSFADLHAHAEGKTIDEDLMVLQDLADRGDTHINLLAVNYVEFDSDHTFRTLFLKETFKKAKMYAYGSLRYDKYENFYTKPFLKQAEDLLKLGCDGIKFLEAKPNYRSIIGFGLDSKLYDDMFDMLEERQIPITIHINDPIDFWDKNKMSSVYVARGWCYDSPEFLTFDEILNEVLKRLKRNPDLKIVFAHCMYLYERREQLIEVLETYPNIAIDTTPGIMYMEFSKDIKWWQKFFETYADRIYYGTDSGFYPTKHTMHETVVKMLAGDTSEIPVPHHPDTETMRGLDLNETIQKKIFKDNFLKLLGEEPKPVNIPMLLDEADKLYHTVKIAEGECKITKRLKRICTEL